MPKPSKFYPWEQGRQNLMIGSGVCYGLCIRLGKEKGASKTTDLAKTFDLLEGKLKNTGTRILQSGISKQKTEEQYSRNRVNPPLPENVPVVILCNTASSPGFCTRYSLFSYINPLAWFGNHACLLWHGDDGTLIFDPNCGLSLWPNITDPDYLAVMKMLDWGYCKVGIPCPVYVWGFQTVYKGE